MALVFNALHILLEEHNHISYDLDGTLFGIRSNILIRYIEQHPNKIHSVVTSRQNAMRPHTMTMLHSMFKIPLPFEHIIHSPSDVLEGHQVNPNFKGETCKSIGATVLIDDCELHQLGCITNGIAFININAV